MPKSSKAGRIERELKVHGHTWLNIPKKYSLHLKRFIGMHNRVYCGKVKVIKWVRNEEGFYLFLKEIGSIPKNMEWPSVGRKDHSKGYIGGNIRWEEYRHNSVKRKGTKWENFKGHKVRFISKKQNINLDPKSTNFI